MSYNHWKDRRSANLKLIHDRIWPVKVGELRITKQAMWPFLDTMGYDWLDNDLRPHKVCRGNFIFEVLGQTPDREREIWEIREVGDAERKEA